MFATPFEDSQDYPICGKNFRVSISGVHFEEREGTRECSNHSKKV